MPRFFLSHLARSDIEEIWQFIAADRVSAADNLIDRFYEAIELLAQHPGAGQIRNDLKDGIRTYPVGKYLVFYISTDYGLDIVRIAHGARDLPGLFR